VGGLRPCGVSANEYSCAHGAQINFRDLALYLTYACSYCISIFCPLSRQRFANKTFISPEDARGKKEIKVSLIMKEITKNKGLSVVVKHWKTNELGVGVERGWRYGVGPSPPQLLLQLPMFKCLRGYLCTRNCKYMLPLVCSICS
jgi:hypothetical protein